MYEGITYEGITLSCLHESSTAALMLATHAESH